MKMKRNTHGVRRVSGSGLGLALSVLGLALSPPVWSQGLVEVVSVNSGATSHQALGEKYPSAQYLITGVGGPGSNAHGPNEFLHVPLAKGLTACVAHVAVDPKSKAVTVKKIWQTLDVGTVVHPDGAMAQAEGATLWGVSMALHEAAQFEDGQVKQRNLDTYQPLRMADVPELDLKFMESTEFPSGLGEPPLIAVQPAIGNAVYAATGKRIRDLPIRL